MSDEQRHDARDPFAEQRIADLQRRLAIAYDEADSRAAAAERQVAELSAHVRALGAERERLLEALGSERERTIQEVRRTSTWRAGMAVTRPVRALLRVADREPVAQSASPSVTDAPTAPPPAVVPSQAEPGTDWPLPVLTETVTPALPVLEPLDGQRVVVIAAFDERRRIGLAVRHMAAAYKEAGWRVVLMYSMPLTQGQITDSEHVWREVVDGVYWTHHSRRDFHSWQLALRAVPGLSRAHSVILANDSVVGPLFDVGPLLREMVRRGDDVVGAVESATPQAHLQSWLVYFGPRVLESGDLNRFLALERGGLDKRTGIELLEVPLAANFLRLGYRVSAVLTALMLDAGMENTSVARWDRILDLGVPFVKRELFTNPVWMQRVDAETVLVKCRSVSPVDPTPLFEDSLDSIDPARTRDQTPRVSRTDPPAGTSPSAP